MMLYMVGLGLYDEMDISLKGLNVLKNMEVVYAEFYTARLFGGDLKALEKLINIEIQILSREQVEEENIPLEDSKEKDVAFLTAGDPLIATTHSDLLIQARKANIKTQVIHSSSIISAAPGIAGLQAYKFGKVTTIPFPEENYFPHSPYQVIEDNMKLGLHTLILLDIQAHKDRYMTANQGLEYLLKVGEERKDDKLNNESLAVVLARVGSQKPMIRADSFKNLLNEDFGGPLHSLIIPGELHFMEAEALTILAGASKKIME
jgi:diphthine synthase